MLVAAVSCVWVETDSYCRCGLMNSRPTANGDAFICGLSIFYHCYECLHTSIVPKNLCIVIKSMAGHQRAALSSLTQSYHRYFSFRHQNPAKLIEFTMCTRRNTHTQTTHPIMPISIGVSCLRSSIFYGACVPCTHTLLTESSSGEKTLATTE